MLIISLKGFQRFGFQKLKKNVVAVCWSKAAKTLSWTKSLGAFFDLLFEARKGGFVKTTKM